MFEPMRKEPLKALLVFGVPLIVVVVYLALVANHTLNYNDGEIGGLLDDTWIHVRFAESISEGRGLSYNDGVPTPGATSPLWVMLLGVVYAVGDPGTFAQVDVAVVMSACSAALAVLAITGFGWYLSRRAWIGLVAGLITAVTGRFIWMAFSGMEITTFTTLAVLTLWSHVDDLRRERTLGWRTGILAALATLARPEAYLLALLIGLDTFVLVPLRRGGLRFDRLRAGWHGIVAYLLLAGSYPLAALLMTGHPMPNTFRVKSSLGEAAPDLLYGYFWTPRVDHGWVLIALAALAVVWLLWRTWRNRDAAGTGMTGFAVVLWPVAFVVATLYLGPDHYVVNNGRYVAPAIPFHALLGTLGAWLVSRSVARLGSERNYAVHVSAAILLSAVMVGMAFWYGRNQGHQVANDVAQLRAMHVAAGEWVRENTGPDDVIALNDVGAITHISDREVLDMVGLVSPEMIERLEGTKRFTCPHDLAIAREMLENPPTLIGIFPWFFPCLTHTGGQGFPDMLTPYNIFEITGPTVIAGGEMVFYRPNWDNWPIYTDTPDDMTATDVSFEQGIDLEGYTLSEGDDSLRVTLWWHAAAQPAHDYTVFLHLVDSEGDIIAQRDSRPQDGHFNTQWWRTGDIIPDRRPLDVPGGTLPDEAAALRVGLYRTDDGTRLLRAPAPSDQPDFALLPLGGEASDAG